MFLLVFYAAVTVASFIYVSVAAKAESGLNATTATVNYVAVINNERANRGLQPYLFDAALATGATYMLASYQPGVDPANVPSFADVAWNIHPRATRVAGATINCAQNPSLTMATILQDETVSSLITGDFAYIGAATAQTTDDCTALQILTTSK